MLGLYLMTQANRLYLQLVEASWAKAVAAHEDATAPRFRLRDEVNHFASLLIIGALLEAQNSVTQAAKILGLSHQSLISLMNAPAHRQLLALRHAKRPRSSKRRKVAPKLRQPDATPTLDWLTEEVKDTSLGLLKWFKTYPSTTPLTLKRVVNGFRHDLIFRALKYEDTRIKFVKKSGWTSVTRASRMLGFPHHQSLIHLIETQYKDLLAVRAKPRPRRKHLMVHPKRGEKKSVT